jgi:hypothetical protein
VRDCLLQPDIHADAPKRLLGMARQRLWKALQQARSCLDQQQVRLFRINGAEIGCQRLARQFNNGASHLDPSRPATDDDDGEEPFALARIGLHLRALEGEQQTSAHLRGVVDRLQAGRMGGPAVMAEIAMGRPGREHQNVIGNVAVRHDYAFAHTVDTSHRAQQHAGIVLAPDQTSNGPGDVGRRQASCRHLVEQWLKEVVVLPVNQGDVHRRLGKPLSDTETSEAGADDYHARASAAPAAGCVLRPALLQGLRRMKGHAPLFTLAGVARRRPNVERHVAVAQAPD